MPAWILRRFVPVVLLVAATATGCGSSDGPGSESGSGSAATAGPSATGAPVTSGGVPGGSPTTTTPARVRTPFGDFKEGAFRISGSPAQRCALLAETDAQQALGLMNRRDLGGYDGMLFLFQTNTTSEFYMKNTLIPLSIAWFDANGRLVSTADMEPCVTVECPLYGASRAYRYALEVPKGGLAPLGIGAGSVITIGGACT